MSNYLVVSVTVTDEDTVDLGNRMSRLSASVGTSCTDSPELSHQMAAIYAETYSMYSVYILLLQCSGLFIINIISKNVFQIA